MTKCVIICQKIRHNNTKHWLAAPAYVGRTAHFVWARTDFGEIHLQNSMNPPKAFYLSPGGSHIFNILAMISSILLHKSYV